MPTVAVACCIPGVTGGSSYLESGRSWSGVRRARRGISRCEFASGRLGSGAKIREFLGDFELFHNVYRGFSRGFWGLFGRGGQRRAVFSGVRALLGVNNCARVLGHWALGLSWTLGAEAKTEDPGPKSYVRFCSTVFGFGTSRVLDRRSGLGYQPLRFCSTTIRLYKFGSLGAGNANSLMAKINLPFRRMAFPATVKRIPWTSEHQYILMAACCQVNSWRNVRKALRRKTLELLFSVAKAPPRRPARRPAKPSSPALAR